MPGASRPCRAGRDIVLRGGNFAAAGGARATPSVTGSRAALNAINYDERAAAATTKARFYEMALPDSWMCRSLRGARRLAAPAAVYLPGRFSVGTFQAAVISFRCFHC